MSGAELPNDIILDGRDPLPVLTQGTASPHRSFFFKFRRHAALRMGDWKIVRARETEPWRLFDLSTDVGERNDLAAQERGRFRKLTAEYSHWEKILESANAK